MFLKSFPKASSHTNLKSSEQRKLRRDLKDAFPFISDEQLEEIVPKSMMSQRLPDHMMLYSTDEAPMVLTVSPKQDETRIIPTLYLLHMAPQIIPTVTIYPGLQKKLRQGADFFVPGIVMEERGGEVQFGQGWVKKFFGKFNKGDLRILVEEGFWAPVALASWAVSSEELEFQGARGKAFDIIHILEDALWEEGHKRIPKKAPASAAAALVQFEQARIDAIAERQRKEEERERQKKEQAKAAYIAEAPKEIKRKTKLLRQIEELKEKDASALSEEQRGKVAREDDLRKEIADVEARLAALLRGEDVDLDNLGAEAADGAEVAEAAVAAEAAVVEGVPETAEGTVNEAEAEGDGVKSQGEESQGEESQGEEAGGDEQGEGEEEKGEAAGERDQVAGAEGAAEAEALVPGEEPMSMDDTLLFSFLMALKTSIKPAKDFPMLVSTFVAQHLTPASQALQRAQELQIKKTKYKKIGAFLEEMRDRGVIQFKEEKAGVLYLTGFDNSHSDIVSFDVDEHKAEKAPVEEDAFIRRAEATWKLPKSGAQKIVIEVKKVRGNKNITIVRNLERFGIPIQDSLVRDLAKHFSAAVAPTEDGGIQVQGKYATQVEKFLMTRFNMPKKLFSTDSAGQSKKDKAVNL